jgi:pyruvate-formate lyase-activating enzyme
MINKFCKILSNGILFTNVGYEDKVKYKPCCFFSKEFEIDSPGQFQMARRFVSSINDWTPYCQKCKNFEDSGVSSARMEYNRENYDDGVSIEIQIDRTCNAACITCGEWSSTTWSKYNNKIKGKPASIILKPKTESNFQKVVSNLDFKDIKISSIHILGGEPFATDTHLRILSLIPEEKTKDIFVSYTTNGSYPLTYKEIEVFKKYKMIDFSFSFDGINEVFDYHRWPLRWHQIEKNFNETIELCQQYNINVLIGVGCTLTPLNIFYLKNLYEWKEEKYKKYNKEIELDFWPAFGVMSLAGIDQIYREKLFEMYSNNAQLLGYINSQPFTQYAVNELLKHLNFHDIHRNLDWRKTFPEVAKFYDK